MGNRMNRMGWGDWTDRDGNCECGVNMRSEVPVTGRSTSKTTAEVQEELVEGARRVWRIMKATATGAVIFTIALVASLEEDECRQYWYDQHMVVCNS